ncbi:MAG: TonB-dependent receptor [Gemmatimonadota bacterium]|nr:TonB-dependent receptor [Gemmatimonadota bacterium]
MAIFFGTVDVDAQQTGQSRDTVAQGAVVHKLEAITVTATRTEKRVLDVPKPIHVVGSEEIVDQAANSIGDLFRELPGLAVTGVGANQVRPSIRGQRGQRILLLEDGIRLHNSRRQQDFGELPALIDVSSVKQVEVVRGPASVLYGSDAIGGVVNVITRRPEHDGIRGTASYRMSSHDAQSKFSSSLSGGFDRFSFRAAASARKASDYLAPSGSFGDITLADTATVVGTGVRDGSVDFYAGYQAGEGQELYAKFEYYNADTAGFGFVDPAAYDPGASAIEILYPLQRFGKLSAGFRGVGINTGFADKLDVTAFSSANERQFDLNILIPAGPSANISIDNRNFTEMRTNGIRAEATKLVRSNVLLTYGFDFYRDRSDNADTNTTSFAGFPFPIPDRVSTTPTLPNAFFQSGGVFVQGDVQAGEKTSVIAGVRAQTVKAETRVTDGITDPLIEHSDGAVVGALNVIHRASENVNLIGSIGRAFRSPNLVERFFNGPTPEGGSYQATNPDLGPETSLNIDLGVRVSTEMVEAEAFIFQNNVNNGIRIEQNGDTIIGLPVHHNVNIDELRFRGAELNGTFRLGYGAAFGLQYTHLSSTDVLNPDNPVGDTFSNNVVANVAYRHPSNKIWGEASVRHNGERKDVDLGGAPVGAVLPAFTVVNVRAGVTLFERNNHVQQLRVAILNLTDALYAESANASFFRPEPGRRVVVSWNAAF